jgi:hypothetical protein
LKPTISGAAVLATTSRQRRIRSTSSAIGFSQKIALPARAACSIRSACMSVGAQIATASTAFELMIASIALTVAPVDFASAAAAAASTSAT